ncbi:beta-glucoside operon transcriptional antiterminator [Kineosphaera limosa]|uniref:Beta-glucoside operon transcriptional antiterminator n=1 Tax=Kineosphaera limosa NBRC 100340 TaxID=1184609 RepID=K6WV55_9MICO|nr:PRD domain-containing protein [Kineosphaera limosa]NYE02488.1 beta-glucoside operon transcriptional antiterminator [Kineosphaera limosa]GAB95987.1 beta-glucoside operon transcriptional antiterminator [Kineosphaera limosa NBRC 100340]
MKVVRALNNNAVLAQDEAGGRVVLMGRGIGFGSRLGDAVDAAAVTHRFVPDVTHPIGTLTNLVDELPLEVAQAAAAITHAAGERLRVTPSQGLLLCVADHLRFALIRLERGGLGAYPLQWEVAQLYPDELSVGQSAVDIASRELGVELPREEAVAFALHFVNAAFATEDLERTVAMTQRIKLILVVVRAALGMDVDDESMSTARFVTHLRYLFVRISSGRQIAEAPELLGLAVERTHPLAHRTALRVAEIFELDSTALTADEVTYLALHIARLARERQTA